MQDDTVGQDGHMWAEGLIVSSTGLSAEARRTVKAVLQAGGGR